ncbi:MAG TPA: folate family ECF transporter S component [Bacilli bacterium]
MESDIFKTPFSKSYWHLASKESQKLQNLIFASLLISLSIVLEYFGKIIPFKPFGRDVYLSFVPLSLIGLIFGPYVAIISGAISDILGYFVFTAGYPFFPGYTLSAMLSQLIYSLFFYRTKITIVKIFFAKFLVNIFINAIIGSYWFTFFSKSPFIVLFISGLLKNIILLPFEVMLLYYCFINLLPYLKAFNLISYKIPEKITFF